VTVLAAVLRAAASFNDLWLDEVWTLWLIAQLVHEPSDIVRGFMRHDNNHLLNTFWMYLLGPHLPSIIYRLPSVVAGSLAVVPAALIGRSSGPLTAVVCGAAFAIDFMLVNLGSEARGYGLMSLFLLIAQWAALERFEGVRRDTPISPIRLRWLPVIFGGACILGLLAHLTFVMGYLGILIWTTWVVVRQRAPLRAGLRTLLAWHGVPLVFTGPSV
jgi:uncharacterized membrane protein